jgi:putative ABC transport system permease protein
MLRDLRFAVRSLRKSPAFTAVAVATLALGIGANTTIFSLINGILLRPLPYHDPDKLVTVDLMSGTSQFPWSYPMFDDLRRDQRSFESVAGFSTLSGNLTGIDNPLRLHVELVSASYFPMLGIEPVVGRVFRPEEDREASAHPLALLSFNLWRRQFAGDPGVIGRAIHLNQLPYTVVGVMPPGFHGQSEDIDVWIPITMAPAYSDIPQRLTMKWNFWIRAYARLKPGVSLPVASAQMGPLAKAIDLAHPHPSQMPPWQVHTSSLAESKIDPALRKSLIVMFAAVGFVLLIACVNVANLLLSRAVSRKKEVAMRLALGASREALLRQFLTESVLLGLVGGLAGFFVAAYGIDLVTALRPEAAGFWGHRAIRAESVQLDGAVFGFNVAISILAGLVFGILPALQASRLDLSQTLKNVSGGWSARWSSLRRPNSRSVLITGEMALALVLLAGAGLMIESFARLLKTRIGAATDHILTASVDLPRRQYPAEAAIRFQQQLLARLAAAPGVQTMSISNSLPARGLNEVNMLRTKNDKGWAAVGVHAISPGYSAAFGIPLLRGRLLTDRDRIGAPQVLLLGASAAWHLFPGEDPIGKHVELQSWEDGHWDTEVVGIVGDVRYDGIEHPAGDDVYVSYWQLPEGGDLVVRVAGDPMSLAPFVRSTIHALDKDLPVYGVESMDQQLSDATSRLRFSAVLLGVFAALALALAAIGMYGVVAYSVAARTREIGIRLALGANREDVFRLVVGDGLLLCLAGLLIGIPSALAATRVLSSFLYDTKPGDPVAFAVVSLVLIVVALIAAYVPARRAMEVDPMVALRYE